MQVFLVLRIRFYPLLHYNAHDMYNLTIFIDMNLASSLGVRGLFSLLLSLITYQVRLSVNAHLFQNHFDSKKAGKNKMNLRKMHSFIFSIFIF